MKQPKVDQATVALAQQVVANKNKSARRDGVEDLVSRLFQVRWPDRSTVATFDELDPTQQAVAKIFAQAAADVARLLGWGLPQRARELERFVGQLPPGPLEGLAPKKDIQRWRQLAASLPKKSWPEALKEALAGLGKAEHAQAVLEVASGAYGLQGLAEEPLPAQLLRDSVMTAGKEVVPFAREVLTRRVKAGAKDGLSGAYLPDHLDLLVEALEAQGVPIDPAWRTVE